MQPFISKKMLGKEVAIQLDSMGESPAIVDAAYQEGLKLERIFSFFDENSELSRLNRKRKIRASPELIKVIQAALELCRLTCGQYDISLGKLFIARKNGFAEQELGCTYADIRIDGQMIELAHPDALIDLGSIAKGFIVDRMVDMMQKEGAASGMVDGRGDIRVFGKDLEIGIQHPREAHEIGYTVVGSAIATSGDYNQFIGSYDKSHIMNSKDFISVTVIADDLMTADAYATAIFVSGTKRVGKILQGTSIKALAIDANLNPYVYNGFILSRDEAAI